MTSLDCYNWINAKVGTYTNVSYHLFWKWLRLTEPHLWFQVGTWGTYSFVMFVHFGIPIFLLDLKLVEVLMYFRLIPKINLFMVIIAAYFYADRRLTSIKIPMVAHHLFRWLSIGFVLPILPHFDRLLRGVLDLEILSKVLLNFGHVEVDLSVLYNCFLCRVTVVSLQI